MAMERATELVEDLVEDLALGPDQELEPADWVEGPQW